MTCSRCNYTWCWSCGLPTSTHLFVVGNIVCSIMGGSSSTLLFSIKFILGLILVPLLCAIYVIIYAVCYPISYLNDKLGYLYSGSVNKKIIAIVSYILLFVILLPIVTVVTGLLGVVGLIPLLYVYIHQMFKILKYWLNKSRFNQENDLKIHTL